MRNHQHFTVGSNLTLERIVTGPVQENTYFLYDQDGLGYIIDPGDQAPDLLAAIAASHFQPQAILLTHAHFDHVGALDPIRQALGIPAYLHAADLEWLANAQKAAARWGIQLEQPAPPDGYLEHGQLWSAGQVQLEVRHLAGHAPGHVVFVGSDYVISGDTLFQNSIGRTDFPGCDAAALLSGIRRELFSLADHVQVFSGHGAETQIGHEKKHNPYVRPS